MTTIAVPVVAICLLVTSPEVDDTAHSTVLSQELRGCTICNTADKPCAMPPAFEALARELNGEAKP